MYYTVVNIWSGSKAFIKVMNFEQYPFLSDNFEELFWSTSNVDKHISLVFPGINHDMSWCLKTGN